eukprot:m.71967 g.71967  ORF g.71967 m.71967 type:complete len:448 (+) comp12293_c0_seq1:164-1507(+)
MEEHFILRLPEDIAGKVHDGIDNNSLGARLKIGLGAADRTGNVKVEFDGKSLSGELVNLPTITETLRTADNKTFYKIADISQMVICKEKATNSGTEADDEADGEVKERPLKNWPRGLTPPLKNVRRKRFRKTAPIRIDDTPKQRIQEELQELLNRDNKAFDVTYKIIDETAPSQTVGDVARMDDLDAFERGTTAATSIAGSEITNDADAQRKRLTEAGFASDSDSNQEDELLRESPAATSVAGTSVAGTQVTDGASILDLELTPAKDLDTARSIATPAKDLESTSNIGSNFATPAKYMDENSNMASSVATPTKDLDDNSNMASSLASPLKEVESNSDMASSIVSPVKHVNGNNKNPSSVQITESASEVLPNETSGDNIAMDVERQGPNTTTDQVEAKMETDEDSAKKKELQDRIESLKTRVETAVNPILKRKFEKELQQANADLNAL